MLKLKYTSQFKKDYKNLKSSKYNPRDLEIIISALANENTLDPKYKDHSLKGELKSFRECHIKPDWLLIYELGLNKHLLILVRTGSHSELYK
jgi:mRNA interferase YafQ